MSTSQPAPQPHSDPAPGFAPEFGSAPAPRKKSKGPAILMVLGGIILLLSLIIGTILTVVGVGNTADGLSEIEQLPGGSGSITAEEGDVLQLYAPEGTTATCTIMTPDGAEPGPGTNQSSTTTFDGVEWVSFASFEATTAGEYQISCDSPQVAVGPPVSLGGIFGAIGGILLGIFGGILGFLLLLAGLIWWLVARKKD
ncbi:hypothetical protein M3C58_13465 [Brachybacterium muris]|uniref:hypothetical protein n=1 Tax=Brachybacterium muris TaxID=219301 RepID=UPI0021A6562B|nr:hypothetical protein [Brachybacterium muris]MCT1999181.1 hypothetical protein [Brachybacterium muris]